MLERVLRKGNRYTLGGDINLYSPSEEEYGYFFLKKKL